jgi:hypothetical protein
MVLADEKDPGNRNLLEFRRKVLTKTLKMQEPEQKRHVEASVLTGAERREQIFRRVMQQNSDQIHRDYILFANRRIKEGIALTGNEVAAYVESAEALGREIPNLIQNEYLEHINRKVDVGQRITETEIKRFQEYAVNLNKPIPDPIRVRYGHWLTEPEPGREFKETPEYREAVQFFRRAWQQEREQHKERLQKRPWHPPESKRPDLSPKSHDLSHHHPHTKKPSGGTKKRRTR